MAYDAIYEFIQECFVGKKGKQKKNCFYIIFYFTYETNIVKFLAEVFSRHQNKCSLNYGSFAYQYQEIHDSKDIKLMIRKYYSLRPTFFVLYSILRCPKILSCF